MEERTGIPIASYFTGDTYDTPANTPRYTGDKLLLNSRWFFVASYLSLIWRCRGMAIKGAYDNQAWASSSWEVVDMVEGCGGSFHISGMNNLHSLEGPVVFISNHMSTLETFVFPGIIQPIMDVTFVVKNSLVTNPLFGPVMRSRDPIVVDRVNAREDFQKVMTEGKKRLAAGISVIIFPQSTRTDLFNPEEFNTLGVKLAKAAGVQVVPVAIKTDFWANGSIIKDAGPIFRDRPVYIKFGQPMTIQGSGKEEHKQIVDFISSNVLQWGGKVKQALG